MILIKISASVVLFFLISLIGSYDYRVEAIAGDIIYSLILLKISKSNKTQDYLILLLPILVIEGLIRSLNFEDTFFSLPPFAFKLIPFILYLIFKGREYLKFAFISNVILTLLLNVFFYDNWLNYVNTGTLSGKIDSIKISSLNLLNYANKKDTLKIDDSSGIKIIDFWTESCGACYKKFPDYSELKSHYAANNNITFITALNSKNNKYIEIAQRIDSTYKFRTYLISDNDCERLKVNSFPTILIFNNNAVIFRGSVETLDSFMRSEDFQNLIQL